MRQLFRIGEMAKLFGMNIRTLRFYDQIGLLCPVYTDPDTRYRYYSTEQFERLNTIRYLRAQGVSLEAIAAQLNHRNPDQVLDLLKRQQLQVKRQLRELRNVQKRLESRERQIKDAVRTDRLNQIWLEEHPRRPIAVLRRKLHTGDDLEVPLRDLENSAGLGPSLFLGKVGLTAAQEDLASGRFDAYSSLFYLLEEGESSPAGEELAVGKWAHSRFRGTHEDSVARYPQLLDWLKGNGYTVRGDAAEFTLVDYGLTDDPSQFVTEIQIPID